MDDTMAVEGDVQPPKAKKPRLSGRGQKRAALSPEPRAS